MFPVGLPRFLLLLVCAYHTLPGRLVAAEWQRLADSKNAVGFDDDLNSKLDQHIVRDVQWLDSRALIRAGGAIERRIRTGAVAELTIHLETIEPDQNCQWKFALGFLLTGKEGRALLCQRTEGKKQIREVKILAVRQTKEGGSVAEVVRQFPLPLTPLKRIVLRYNHGVLRVLQDNTFHGSAELNFFDETLEGVAMFQQSGTTTCRRWELTALPGPKLDQAQLTARNEARQTLIDASNQSTQLFQAGAFDECIEATQHAINVSRKHFGPANGITLSLLSRLASCYGYIGQQQRALETYRDALVVTRNALGDQHPDTARRLRDTATHLSLMGRPVDAHRHYLEAIEIFDDVLGSANAETASAYHGLASSLSSLNRIDEGIKAAEDAAKCWISMEGGESIHVADSLALQALLYSQKGKHDKSARLYRSAANLFSQNLGAAHNKTLSTRIQLANQLQVGHSLAEAQQVMLETVKTLESSNAADSVDGAIARVELAKICQSLGDQSTAERNYRQAAEVLLRPDSANDPRAGPVLSRCAGHTRSHGNLEEAAKWTEYAISLSQRVNGPKHALTSQLVRDLAVLRESQRQLNAASAAPGAVIECAARDAR